MCNEDSDSGFCEPNFEVNDEVQVYFISSIATTEADALTSTTVTLYAISLVTSIMATVSVSFLAF